ncbi:hypothetical protein EPI10_027163 [Gossypium australe]|uniref:Uncharacterized protein n=1 Tax=Gossypium australe TaxID=47621 RepID=A0A5B6UUW7_9ROSI|nr:hypothetical protein EPI10_027163 [Gossypium australe]
MDRKKLRGSPKKQYDSNTLTYFKRDMKQGGLKRKCRENLTHKWAWKSGLEMPLKALEVTPYTVQGGLGFESHGKLKIKVFFAARMDRGGRHIGYILGV